MGSIGLMDEREWSHDCHDEDITIREKTIREKAYAEI
jgi:hypothetical protein